MLSVKYSLFYSMWFAVFDICWTFEALLEKRIGFGGYHTVRMLGIKWTSFLKTKIEH